MRVESSEIYYHNSNLQYIAFMHDIHVPTAAKYPLPPKGVRVYEEYFLKFMIGLQNIIGNVFDVW